MAHDDEKPDAGDDPWAGLDAEGLPDLEGNFSFSFDEEPGTEPPEEASPSAAGAAEPSPLADDHEPFPLAAPGTEADDEPFTELTAAATDDVFAEAVAPDVLGADDAAVGDGIEDAAIDDWLNDGDAAASSILPFESPDHAVLDGGDLADAAASESMVEIGTGTSGIPSPSSIEPAADAAVEDAFAAEDADPFAALSAEEAAGAAEDMFAFAAESAAADEFTAAHGPAADDDGAGESDAHDAFAAVGAAGAVGAVVAEQVLASGGGRPGAGAAKRPAASRRKQPSMIGQLVGVIFGGALAIPITLAILLWGLGKDPFGIAPMVPESLAFLVPPKFRPAAALGTDAIDLAAAPTLDAVVGDAAADDAAPGAGPEDVDLAGSDPAVDPAQPLEPEPLPDEPAETDLAVVTDAPADRPVDSGDDPLMDLLDERDAAPPVAEPPPAPAPEPLDLAELDAAVASATAALEAAAAVDDPSDPVRRRLLAKWYRALAGYAEQLVSLESLAAETGRPFEPAAERADAVRAGLAEHPQLLEDLVLLSRDWIDYAKRPSDGLVMPATFVAARRVGPYWRSQVTLPASGKRPAAEVVVLTRTEPAVAPGDAVVVTGLAIDDDAVWAVEVRPASVRADGFPGL